MSRVRSRKSTPIVASVFSGNLPVQNRYVRHVLPTSESPITMILKTLLGNVGLPFSDCNICLNKFLT
uniref:Uncharacterized protein n=1 Tax=Ciona intestinalis TaxID=7719 RepID=H2Y0L4_CIOIN